MLVASASQDKFVRLWKVSCDMALSTEKGDDYGHLNTKAYSVKIGNVNFSFNLDAVLMGHDDWIHSVSWQPSLNENGIDVQPMALVTASADKTVCIWRPDTQSESWIVKSRVGEVGGSTLGYYGANFFDSGTKIVANGYHGALHYWQVSSTDSACTPFIGSSGHSKEVTQVAWDPTGSFLMSCSLDQTCRVYAPWNRDAKSSWHEIARTQIHGYDMRSISFIDKYTTVSASDEKVIRVFEAPRMFAESLQRITGVVETKEVLESRPMGANLPALGLSNKAVFETSKDIGSYAPTVAPLNAKPEPPFEEQLLQNTLWPEIDKLYPYI